MRQSITINPKRTALILIDLQVEQKVGPDYVVEDIDDALSKEAEINLYRIVQERVNNILKHSGANEAKIELWKTDGFLNLTIEDAGEGFDAETAKKNGGLGLNGIAERAKIIAAEYAIDSAAGKGTKFNLRVKTNA